MVASKTKIIYLALMGSFLSFLVLFLENYFLQKYIYLQAGNLSKIFLIIYPFIAAFVFFVFYYQALNKNQVYVLRKILFILFTFIIILIVDAVTFKIVGKIVEPQNLKIINGKAITPTGTYFMRPPPCPIATTFTFPAFLIRGKMSYPTLPIFLVVIFFIWFVPVLFLGRSFCSWLCPFGGIDEFFSSLNDKFKNKFKTIHNKAVKFLTSLEPEWFNFRILFFLVLLAFAVVLGKIIFCEWFCPLQFVYTPPSLAVAKGIIKGFFIFGGAIAFLIVLPLITGKRIFCSFICPAGGLKGFVGYFNFFSIKKNYLCNNCKICEKNCPLLIKFNEKGEKGNLITTCANCFKCIEKCPTSALDIYFKKEIPAKEIFIFFILLLSINLIFFVSSGGAFFTLFSLAGK